MERHLHTTDVAEMLGVTFRQLDHWRTKGWIDGLEPSPGSGYPVCWSEQSIESARRLIEASELKQLDLPHLAEAIVKIRNEGRDTPLLSE